MSTSPVAPAAAHTPSFEAHLALLQLFLGRRDQIVEKIQAMLNAQARPGFTQDRATLSRQFEDAFFAGTTLEPAQLRLRGQLQQAHWDAGFRPRVMPGIPNDMFDPGDMMTRAFGMWQQTRWPGRNGRVRYAQMLFDLYIVRCVTLLNMRVWDEGDAVARLVQVQGVLQQLRATSPPSLPVLVRDARWLVPVAQSPTTDDLGPYFEVAQHIAALPDEHRIEIHKASVLMAGGHLRSQLRHYTMQGTPLNDQALLLTTRGSNALDFAMTIQNLVPLLQAYETACAGDDRARRLALAGAICQGVSPDPELFVNRTELLGAYSMIEHLFITADDGHASYTPMGARHLQLVHEYIAGIGRVARALHEDSANFRPAAGTYSPYGLVYGFSSNLIELMAMKALQTDAVTQWSLEDVFAEETPSAEKLAWVSGWRKLPHIPPEVLRRFEYPQAFAEQIFTRVAQALQIRAGVAAEHAGAAGKLVVRDEASAAAALAHVPELAPRFVLSSDPVLVAAGRATSCAEQQLLDDRREGMHLVSYRTAGGWVALSKDVLTEVLGAGLSAQLGMPRSAAAVLQLMCPGLVQIH